MQKIDKIYKDGSMDISLQATSHTEVLHEVKKWMPDLTVIAPKELALEAKSIADRFINSQIEQLIQ